MLDVNIDVLESAWAEQKKYLKEGLISGDIWDTSTGLSLSGYNNVPEATALFNGMTEEVRVTLAGSGFPDLNKFYLLNLSDDKLCIIINHGEKILQGMLLDPNKVNMGMLFAIAVPKALAKVAEAQN